MALFFGVTIAFVGTLLLGMSLIPLSRRIGLVDRPCSRKNHCKPIPLVGGTAMLSAFAVGAVVAGVDSSFFVIVAGAFALLALGLADDLRDIDYRARFLVQGLAASLLVIGANVRVESLGDLFGFGPIELGVLSIPFSVFAVVGMINAINMLDGLDGLAGGICLVILTGVATLAAAVGSPLIIPALILAAAVFGFLMLNYRLPWRQHACIFMGDSGSYVLGYCIAWLVIELPRDAPQIVAPAHSLWLVGLPVAETLTTMWRRRGLNLSLFRAGQDHAHHLLRRAGFRVDVAVMILMMLTACFVLVAIAGARNHLLPESALMYLYIASSVGYLLFLKSLVILAKPTERYPARRAVPSAKTSDG